MRMKRIIAFIVLILMIFNTADAGTKSKDMLRKHFNKLKFGMFIHFNMGTFHEKEWVEPGQDPLTLNPAKLDCGQWAGAAKSAHMKYAVLTTKHHDGFCLWDSKTTSYEVASSSVAGRDIVMEFCDAFRSRGIEPHFYFQCGIEHLVLKRSLNRQISLSLKPS